MPVNMPCYVLPPHTLTHTAPLHTHLMPVHMPCYVPPPPPSPRCLPQGTLDCVRSNGVDGAAAGPALVRRLWDSLETPGTLLLASHSPPSERLMLLKNTVYWHGMRVRQGACHAPECVMCDVLMIRESGFEGIKVWRH